MSIGFAHMDSAPVDDAPAQRLPTAALGYKYIPFVNKMADDKGSGAEGKISSWRPNLPQHWFYLGQGVSSTPDRSIPLGMIVHAFEDDALKDVSSWECVWTDKGSGSDRDFALWRGIPPNDDYAVIGGIFSDNAGWAAPTWDQTQGIKAIRKDLLVFAEAVPVWMDFGSGADQDGSVWIATSAHDVAPLVLIPMLGHMKPPRDRSFSLNRDKIVQLL